MATGKKSPNGLECVPDNPRGKRSMSWEMRCKGKGEWNAYDVVCVDGTVKLSVNGKFVNGKASALEATYTWKSEQDFERFMRFAQRYADSSGLGYSQDSGEAAASDNANG